MFLARAHPGLQEPPSPWQHPYLDFCAKRIYIVPPAHSAIFASRGCPQMLFPTASPDVQKSCTKSCIRPSEAGQEGGVVATAERIVRDPGLHSQALHPQPHQCGPQPPHRPFGSAAGTRSWKRHALSPAQPKFCRLIAGEGTPAPRKPPSCRVCVADL